MGEGERERGNDHADGDDGGGGGCSKRKEEKKDNTYTLDSIRAVE